MKKLLGEYRGNLRVNAATVYDFLHLDGDCIDFGCFGTCRRFFEALSTAHDHTNTAVGFVAKLDLLERETMDMEVEQRTR